MKATTLSFFGFLAALAGALIIYFHQSITPNRIVITGGILFVAVGLVNLIIFGQKYKEGEGFSKLLTQITNAAAIVLGICMLVFQSTFTPLLTFIFGLLVAVCALWQFFVLAIGVRPYLLHGWTYIFPLGLLGIALYIFFNSKGEDGVIMLATGIALAFLGLGCLCEGIALGIVKRKKNKEQTLPTADQEPADDKPTAEAEDKPNPEAKTAEIEPEKADSEASKTEKKEN